VARKRPYHHGDLRDALLRAAGAILRETGAAHITVREAARRAGVSHNAPYRHFPDRESLLAALAKEAFIEFARVLKAASESPRPENARKNLAEAYVSFALENPERYNLMFGKSIPDSLYAQFEPIARSSFETLKDVMSRSTGVKDPALEDMAARQWGQVHGLVSLMLNGQLHFLKQEKTPERLIARLMEAGNALEVSQKRRSRQVR
jgi:AcrR family transcriptional regulator